MDAEERIQELQHRLKHEASIKSLCADLELPMSKMTERIGAGRRRGRAARTLGERREQIEKLGGFCQTTKKNLDTVDTSFEAQVNTTDDAQLTPVLCRRP